MDRSPADPGERPLIGVLRGEFEGRAHQEDPATVGRTAHADLLDAAIDQFPVRPRCEQPIARSPGSVEREPAIEAVAQPHALGIERVARSVQTLREHMRAS